MQRLEITGDTPEALYFNVIKTLSLFLRGPQQTAPVVDPLPSSDNGSSGEVRHDGSTPSEGTTPGLPSELTNAVLDKAIAKTAKEKKGAKGKTEKALNDDISDVGKTIEHEPQTITLDGDIRPRLREIQTACTKRGLDMPATISYIQKLYGPFGIAKAEQLKPDQMAEFMEMSDGYLSGEA